jgi:DNA processing protein
MTGGYTREAGLRYVPPSDVLGATVADLLAGTARAVLTETQLDLLASMTSQKDGDPRLFVAGDAMLLKRRCVSIIGARNATDAGCSRARRLARELADQGIVVMSGLAEGIDTAAMRSAIDAGGYIIGVIGTSLSQAYPATNKRLQEEIYRKHLLLSQFQAGDRVLQSNFPKRNRLMALLSDATVVIEASDSSGTLHQASECIRLGRWLLIARNVVENPDLTWPARFLTSAKCKVLDSTPQLMDVVFGKTAERSGT